MAQKRSRRDYEADQRKQEAPFVLYGTPLPLLDDRARDDGSYVPLWKQEVTDERGRKRLHGAFTGGFSAGYFNSVGSKEGWAPSTFVSSRSNRAKNLTDIRQQKAEDFMDEEDVRERDEAQQLSTTEGFAGFGTQDDSSVRHALDDILRPAEDTTGERLLNKMGWKKGQGIGPRISRKIDPSNPDSEVREFPPEDSPMLVSVGQDGLKGLGSISSEYHTPLVPRSASGMAHQEDPSDDARPGLSFMSQRKMVSKTEVRSGIGVGTLNDTGSDDEDPYDMGPKMSYNRSIDSDKKTKKKKTVISSTANPLLANKPFFIAKSKLKSKQLPSALTSLRKCHDGKLPIAGFVLADELNGFGAMSLSDDKHKPPDVPDDWQPRNLARTPVTTASHTEASISHQQTAASRRLALNEPALPTKSVFDFLSLEARDRLAVASGNTNLPPALNESFPTSSTLPSDADSSQPSLSYPILDAATATSALQRLRKDPPSTTPYATDLSKQGRYKDFLRYSADSLPVAQRVPPLRAPQHKSDKDHLEELAEFAATAELFKPVTGFFASRFTTASTSIPSKTGEKGDQFENASDTPELLSRPMSKPIDPAVEAARMGMFGVATRSVSTFMPTRLLCKRFGVNMPALNED